MLSEKYQDIPGHITVHKRSRSGIYYYTTKRAMAASRGCNRIQPSIATIYHQNQCL